MYDLFGTEMPQSAAIQEKLKRFEDNGRATHQTSKDISNIKQISQQSYVPIYSHQQPQNSANQDISFHDRTSDKEEKQAKGLVQENRVCKYLFKNKNNFALSHEYTIRKNLYTKQFKFF